MKPDWGGAAPVELAGEVVFPGTYFLQKNETLSSIIDRAGGLTENAFLEGTLFTRESLLEREALRLETLANQLELDLLNLAVNPEDAQASAQGMLLVSRLRNVTPVGRLVIDLRIILEGDAESDILLRENDQLYIPQASEEVTVVGEVYNPTSHLFELDGDRDFYVENSGGATENASEQRIYVIGANGAAKMNDGSFWFKRNRAAEIQPGDTIVVPLDASAAVLPRILAATQVIYNIAIATAAINTF
jgi:polysaccharide export outer membrane protein